MLAAQSPGEAMLKRRSLAVGDLNIQNNNNKEKSAGKKVLCFYTAACFQPGTTVTKSCRQHDRQANALGDGLQESSSLEGH